MQDLLLWSESFLILETSFSVLLNEETDWLRKLHPESSTAMCTALCSLYKIVGKRVVGKNREMKKKVEEKGKKIEWKNWLIEKTTPRAERAICTTGRCTMITCVQNRGEIWSNKKRKMWRAITPFNFFDYSDFSNYREGFKQKKGESMVFLNHL